MAALGLDPDLRLGLWTGSRGPVGTRMAGITVEPPISTFEYSKYFLADYYVH